MIIKEGVQLLLILKGWFVCYLDFTNLIHLQVQKTQCLQEQVLLQREHATSTEAAQLGEIVYTVCVEKKGTFSKKMKTIKRLSNLN